MRPHAASRPPLLLVLLLLTAPLRAAAAAADADDVDVDASSLEGDEVQRRDVRSAADDDADESSLVQTTPQTNFIRLGRGGHSQASFLRLGRGGSAGRTSSFMRLGRGGHGTNFLRFGRLAEELPREMLSAEDFDEQLTDGADEMGERDRRAPGGGSSNFLRLGRRDRGFLRLGRAGGDPLARHDRNFIRFGRSDGGASAAEDGMSSGGRQVSVRSPGGSGSNFIRFGRSVGASGIWEALLDPRLTVLPPPSPEHVKPAPGSPHHGFLRLG